MPRYIIKLASGHYLEATCFTEALREDRDKWEASIFQSDAFRFGSRIAADLIGVELGAKVVRLVKKKNPMLAESIRVLGLMIRTEGCLNSENIFTIGELVQNTEFDLFKMPLMGGRSVREIKEALALRKLELKPTRYKPLDKPPMPVGTLPISSQALVALHAEGIDHIEDLVKLTAVDLLRIPRIAKKTVSDIETALSQRGLALKKTN